MFHSNSETQHKGAMSNQTIPDQHRILRCRSLIELYQKPNYKDVQQCYVYQPFEKKEETDRGGRTRKNENKNERKYRKVKKIQNANRKEQTIKDGKQEQKKKS